MWVGGAGVGGRMGRPCPHLSGCREDFRSGGYKMSSEDQQGSAMRVMKFGAGVYLRVVVKHYVLKWKDSYLNLL